MDDNGDGGHLSSSPPNLILQVEGQRYPVHSQVLGQYCRRIRDAMTQPHLLPINARTGLPQIEWAWPRGIHIPLSFGTDPRRYNIPVADAADTVLRLCYQQARASTAAFPQPLQSAVEAQIRGDPFMAAVLAVLAQHLGWDELHGVLDGMLAQCAPRGVELVRFARRLNLRATFQVGVRLGVVLDPYQLEKVAGVTLSEITDALLTWARPDARFIHLIRCAAQLDLKPDQIIHNVGADPMFVITIDGNERLRHFLQWIRKMDIWTDDFFRGWFSRYGYAIVDRIKIRPKTYLDRYDTPRLVNELQKLIREVIKNELVCVPNMDPKFSHWNFEQPEPRPKYNYPSWGSGPSYII